MINLNNIKHIHFLGISGISMNGLAKYILQNYPHIKISGHTNLKDYSLGKDILINPDLDSIINSISLCVYSSSISMDHPEIKKIQSHSIPIIHRSDLLNIITYHKERVLVIGSHGKTSIVTYCSQLLAIAEPNVFVGGILENNESFISSNKKMVIIEGDESDKSFNKIPAEYIIISNFDTDHLENYNNSFDEYANTFKKFLTSTKKKNKYIIYAKSFDNYGLTLNKIVNNSRLNFINYGFTNDCDVFIKVFEDTLHLEWQILLSKEISELNFIKNKIFKVYNIFGRWNILNITASIILTTLKKIPIPEIINLYKPKRRLECIFNKNNIKIYDDYGVHPTEIENVTKLLVKKYGKKNIIVLFEPHRITRLNNFKNEFKELFNKNIFLDNFFFTDVFEVDFNANKNFNLEDFINYGTYLSKNKIEDFIKNLKENNVLIIFSAGSLSYNIHNILKKI